MKLNEIMDPRIAAREFTPYQIRSILTRAWKIIVDATNPSNVISLERRSSYLDVAVELLSNLRDAIAADEVIKKMKEAEEPRSKSLVPGKKFDLDQMHRIVEGTMREKYEHLMSEKPTAYDNQMRVMVLDSMVYTCNHFISQIEAEIALQQAAK